MTANFNRRSILRMAGAGTALAAAAGFARAESSEVFKLDEKQEVVVIG